MNEELLKKIATYLGKTGLDINIFEKYLDLFHFNCKFGDERGKNGVDLFRNLEYSAVLNLIDLKEHDTILDAGCGDSFFSLYLKSKHDLNIAVLDIDNEKLIVQKRNYESLEFMVGSIDFLRADMSTLPFKKECFDKIVAISSVEHIPGDGDINAFNEFHRLLTPDGILVLTLPFGQEFSETDQGPGGYEKRYDRESLEERFPEKKDLELVSRKYFGHEKIGPFANLWYELKLYEELGVYTPFISSGILKLEDEPEEHSGGVILAYKKKPLDPLLSD